MPGIDDGGGFKPVHERDQPISYGPIVMGADMAEGRSRMGWWIAGLWVFLAAGTWLGIHAMNSASVAIRDPQAAPAQTAGVLAATATPAAPTAVAVHPTASVPYVRVGSLGDTFSIEIPGDWIHRMDGTYASQPFHAREMAGREIWVNVDPASGGAYGVKPWATRAGLTDVTTGGTVAVSVAGSRGQTTPVFYTENGTARSAVIIDILHGKNRFTVILVGTHDQAAALMTLSDHIVTSWEWSY